MVSLLSLNSTLKTQIFDSHYEILFITIPLFMIVVSGVTGPKVK